MFTLKRETSSNLLLGMADMSFYQEVFIPTDSGIPKRACLGGIAVYHSEDATFDETKVSDFDIFADKDPYDVADAIQHEHAYSGRNDRNKVILSNPSKFRKGKKTFTINPVIHRKTSGELYSWRKINYDSSDAYSTPEPNLLVDSKAKYRYLRDGEVTRLHTCLIGEYGWHLRWNFRYKYRIIRHQFFKGRSGVLNIPCDVMMITKISVVFSNEDGHQRPRVDVSSIARAVYVSNGLVVWTRFGAGCSREEFVRQTDAGISDSQASSYSYGTGESLANECERIALVRCLTDTDNDWRSLSQDVLKVKTTSAEHFNAPDIFRLVDDCVKANGLAIGSSDVYSQSNLAYEALQDVGLWDSNGYAYVRDSAAMGKLCIDFAKTILSGPKHLIKSAAKAFLSYHYGIRLQILDTISLLHYMKEYKERIKRAAAVQIASVQANGVDCTVTSRLNIYYDFFSGLEAELRPLEKLDFDLTMENIWDLVPYSFVADWFLTVGNCLTALDNYRNLAAKYRVLASCHSVKSVCSFDANRYGNSFSGIADVSLYLRMPNDSCPKPLPPSLLSQTSPLRHFVEGAALIVSAL